MSLDWTQGSIGPEARHGAFEYFIHPNEEGVSEESDKWTLFIDWPSRNGERGWEIYAEYGSVETLKEMAEDHARACEVENKMVNEQPMTPGQIFDSAYRRELGRSGIDYEEWMHLAASERRAIEKGVQAAIGADPVRQELIDVARYVLQMGRLAGVDARLGDNDPVAHMVGLAMKTLGQIDRTPLAEAEQISKEVMPDGTLPASSTHDNPQFEPTGMALPSSVGEKTLKWKKQQLGSTNQAEWTAYGYGIRYFIQHEFGKGWCSYIGHHSLGDVEGSLEDAQGLCESFHKVLAAAMAGKDEAIRAMAKSHMDTINANGEQTQKLMSLIATLRGALEVFANLEKTPLGATSTSWIKQKAREALAHQPKKEKCPNPGCLNGLVISSEGEMRNRQTHCPTCHGTGVKP